jgi:hypothetical protein
MANLPNKPQWQHDAIAALVLLCMGALLLWRHDQIGPTVDEPFHLVRGLSWWWSGSAKLSFAHPPLANVLMTAPVAAVFPPIDFTAVPGWDTSDHATMAKVLVAERYDEIRPMMLVARLGSVVFGVALAGAVYVWTSRRLGALVGLVALAMVAFNPTILAHAQLVTTDLPVALTVFLSVATFIDYLKPRPEVAGRTGRLWLGTLAFGLAVGAALITKFTALTFIPFFGIVGAVWALRGWGRFTQTQRRARVWAVGRDIALVAVIGILVVGAAYRFEDTFWTMDAIRAAPEPQCHLTEEFGNDFLESRSVLGLLPGWLVMPLPYTWLFGLEMVRSQGHTLHPTYFMGIASSYGNPAYFPTLFLLKTPPVVLLGLALAGARAIRERRRPGAVTGLLLGAAGMLLVLLMTSMLNIGFRHALPIVPLLSVLAAGGLVTAAHRVVAWGGSPSRHRVVTGVVVALLATAALACTANAGRYLSYFNIGRGLGERVSIVGEDWGQDTIHLAKVVQELDLLPLRYHSFGAASSMEIRYQGVTDLTVQRCTRRLSKRGWLAVHKANVLRYPRCFRELRRAPDLIVADHVYLYNLTPEESREAERAAREAERQRAAERSR